MCNMFKFVSSSCSKPGRPCCCCCFLKSCFVKFVSSACRSCPSVPVNSPFVPAVPLTASAQRTHCHSPLMTKHTAPGFIHWLGNIHCFTHYNPNHTELQAPPTQPFTPPTSTCKLFFIVLNS